MKKFYKAEEAKRREKHCRSLDMEKNGMNRIHTCTASFTQIFRESIFLVVEKMDDMCLDLPGAEAYEGCAPMFLIALIVIAMSDEVFACV